VNQRLLDRISGLTRLSWDVLAQTSRHDLTGLSAEFAYYFLLSLFPMLLFIAALLSHLATVPQTLDAIFTALGHLFPEELVLLFQRDIGKWVSSGSLTIFSLSLVLYALAGSRVFQVMLKAFNRIHPGMKQRSGLRIRVVSLLMVLAAGGALGGVLLLNLFGREFRAVIELEAPRFARLFLAAYGEMLGTGMVLFLAAYALYALIPAEHPRKRARAASSAFFAIALIIATGLLRTFTSRSPVLSLYGALGTAILTLVWLYALGFVFFLGAELNAVLLSRLHEGERAQREVKELSRP